MAEETGGGRAEMVDSMDMLSESLRLNWGVIRPEPEEGLAGRPPCSGRTSMREGPARRIDGADMVEPTLLILGAERVSPGSEGNDDLESFLGGFFIRPLRIASSFASARTW